MRVRRILWGSLGHCHRRSTNGTGMTSPGISSHSGRQCAACSPRCECRGTNSRRGPRCASSW
eukprot:1557516-Heterocapsa_arctica.AAC.1